MERMLKDCATTCAVNAALFPLDRSLKEFLKETVGEPTFVVIPESADKITVLVARPVVGPEGTLFREIKKLQEVYYQRPVELFGEEFVISQEENEVFIFHRTWPISGQGANREEAMSDLKQTLHDLKDHYAHTGIDQLDGRAILFRDFILNSLNM